LLQDESRNRATAGLNACGEHVTAGEPTRLASVGHAVVVPNTIAIHGPASLAGRVASRGAGHPWPRFACRAGGFTRRGPSMAPLRLPGGWLHAARAIHGPASLAGHPPGVQPGPPGLAHAAVHGF